jgi:hypothetical protein
VFAAVWLLLGLAGVLAHRRGSLVALSQVPAGELHTPETHHQENA